MRFLIDHNVQTSVQRALKQLKHDVELSKIACGQEAADPLVATTAMDQDRILVSHDRDMKRVQRFLSDTHRRRYPTLSRLMLQCPEAVAAQRLKLFMPLIEFEFEQAQLGGQPMLIWVQERVVRINR